MYTILVTTDLSSESQIAFRPAKEMVHALKAKILLMAVAEEIPPVTMSHVAELPLMIDPKVQEEISDRVKLGLEKMKEQYFEGMEVETIFKESLDPPHRVILDTAEKQKVDMIIMASHGRTGVSHVLFGSVTERVLRETRCPVLVVPTKYER